MIVEDKKLHNAICREGLYDPNSVFAPLSEEDKTLLLDKAVSNTFCEGNKIYREEEKLAGILYLVRGKVKIAKYGVGGREQIIRMTKSHNFIGYRALFADEPTYASATALEETFMIELPFEIILKTIKSNPEFSLCLIKSFATDLRFAENRTVTLTQKHIRGRLAESLLLLISQYGFVADSNTINALLSREDIAKLSNMTPSNAIRTLYAFDSEGVISVKGRSISIIDVDKLKQISSLG